AGGPGIDPPLAQSLQLLEALLAQLVFAAFFAHSMALMVNFSVPPGAVTSATSPTRLPISALPMGDSFEIHPAFGSASSQPAIKYFSALPSFPATVTLQPS